jgi:hypothetical protein
MRDGSTSVVEIAVECPKCGQENAVRVATGNDIDTQVNRVAYYQNPWIKFLPGQIIVGLSCIPSGNHQERSRLVGAVA